MLIPPIGSDLAFVASCLDPSRREAVLKRERRSLGLGALAFTIALAAWSFAQWPALAGSAERSSGDDFMLLIIASMCGWVALAARSNIRLLLAIEALEQRRATAAESGVGA